MNDSTLKRFSKKKLGQILNRSIAIFVFFFFSSLLRDFLLWGGCGDRFLPLRSAMDIDKACFLLTQSKSMHKQRQAEMSPYQRLLAEHVPGRKVSRILVFNGMSKPSPTLVAAAADDLDPYYSRKPESLAMHRRCIPELPDKNLDDSRLENDYRLNLMDWGTANVLLIALGDMVHLCDASNKSYSELVTVLECVGPIMSVSWASDGQRIALGLNSSSIQLWDSKYVHLFWTLPNTHVGFAISALSWYDDNILSTSCLGGNIVNHDIRMGEPIKRWYVGHQREICRLNASRGNDNLIHIWDLYLSSSNPSRWIHKFKNQTSLATSLDWCPFQRNLLACGGGKSGWSINFYNTQIGACLNSIDISSKVSSLLCSEHNHELLSSHRIPKEQLILWKYPSMVKIAELTGHNSPALHMAKSPDRCMVTFAAVGEDMQQQNSSQAVTSWGQSPSLAILEG